MADPLQRCYIPSYEAANRRAQDNTRRPRLAGRGRTGYGSASRVYEHLSTTFGMTPAQYRDGGRSVPIHYAASRTRLGWMLIGATDRGICFLQFAEDEAALIKALRAEFPHAVLTPMENAQGPDFSAWMRALDAYLAGRSRMLDLPLDLRGTAFQILVWEYLQTIPAGTTQSYGAVAAGIGKPSAVRAVACACARNTVGIVVPCHRVIRGNGDLGGYRWSLERKRALLEVERIAARSPRRTSRQQPVAQRPG